MNTKKEIRQQVRTLKKQLTAKQCHAYSLGAMQRLQQLPAFQQAQVVMAYYPLPDELSTLSLLNQWKDKKTILLPVIEEDDIHLRVYTGDESLQVGAYGINEPIGPFFTDYDNIDLVIVPGMAFTSEGARMGRGKGYYDRFLPKVPRALKVGVCYPCQLVDFIPEEEHDIRMDDVIRD